jgi:hypothetical protein
VDQDEWFARPHAMKVHDDHPLLTRRQQRCHRTP